MVHLRFGKPIYVETKSHVCFGETFKSNCSRRSKCLSSPSLLLHLPTALLYFSSSSRLPSTVVSTTAVTFSRWHTLHSEKQPLLLSRLKHSRLKQDTNRDADVNPFSHHRLRPSQGLWVRILLQRTQALLVSKLTTKPHAHAHEHTHTHTNIEYHRIVKGNMYDEVQNIRVSSQIYCISINISYFPSFFWYSLYTE